MMENSNPDSSSNPTLALFGVSFDSKTPEINNEEKTAVKDEPPIPTFHFFLEKNQEQSHTQITKRRLSKEEDREDRRFGLATRLELSDHRWKIKKELTVSDTNSLYRLMLGHKTVSENILPFWSAEAVARAGSAEGLTVDVWDVDIQTPHKLVFKKWPSNNCYIFGQHWKPDFVNRRGLTAGDKVGFFWDVGNSRFCFTVLDRIRVQT